MNTQDYIRKNAIVYERYKDQYDELTPEQIAMFRFEVMQAYKGRGKPCRCTFSGWQPI